MKPRKKRITFLRLAVPSVMLAFTVSFAFAFGLHEYLRRDIQNKTRTCLNEKVSAAMSEINRLNEKDIDAAGQINSWLSVYTQYCIELNDSYKYDSMLISDITDNCYAVSAVIDKDNNIIASNKKKLCVMLTSDANETACWFSCDRERFNIPQLDELFEYYAEIRKDYGVKGNYEIVLGSIYVNKADCSFIPHECGIELSKNTDNSADENILGLYETVQTREFVIETDDENYELIVLNQPSSKDLPRAFACGFYGTEKSIFDEAVSDVSFSGDGISSNEFCSKAFNGRNLLHAQAQNDVYIDGKLYNLYMLFIVDDNAEIVMRLWRKRAVIFTLIALAAALLLSWRQNVVNKARYAFEDYQKVLINNLAHDMKTPLTAIGGYAENAKKSVEKGTPEQTAMFLDAISENVFYTDTIVNRTLELNHLNEIREVKKETVRLRETAEQALEKYSVLLNEKRIDVELSGECEISADKSMIETAIENLISNAVKYTVENGKISVIADSNSFAVVNTTAEQVDTENLKMPFVRGDKSRNGKSNGLGLSIVQSTAELNRLKFLISSTENNFRAVLKK